MKGPGLIPKEKPDPEPTHEKVTRATCASEGKKRRARSGTQGTFLLSGEAVERWENEGGELRPR